MIRLFGVLLLFLALGAGMYVIYRLHIAAIIGWKHVIEDMEENGSEKYADDGELKQLLRLCGITVIPLIFDVIILTYMYMLLGSITL
jgi:hypothetical protein